jgi:hypothetical protein
MAQSNSQFQAPSIPDFLEFQTEHNFSVENSAKLFFAMSKGAGLKPVPFLSNLNKFIMKNFILFLSLFVFLAITAESKAQPYYYNSGIPTLFENWGNLPGGTGVHPSSFAENTEYIIESGKTAVLDFQWFIDNSAILRINAGATLKINHTLNMGVNSTLKIDSAGTVVYNSTALARNSIFAGTENFHIYSFFKVDNWSSVNDPLIDSIKAVSSGISSFEQWHYFGNLEINWTGCLGNWFMINNHFAYNLCGNDFRLTSTGAGKIVTCEKDTNTQTGIRANNYIQTGGELDFSFSSTTSGYASVLWLEGSFTKTGGIIDATDDLAIGAVVMNFGFRDFQDTAYKTFYNSGTMRNIRIHLDRIKLRLLSNMDLPLPKQYCSFYATSSTIDFADYKITGNVPSAMGDCIFKIKDPQGFKNGATGGSFLINGTKEFFYGNTIEYCGNTPQITGDSLPSFLRYISLKINNPFGVTLSKDSRLDTNQTLKFVTGKLNLGNWNFKLGTPDSVQGVNQNCFINTNGTGVVRIGLNQGYAAKYPIGNGTFSPFYITQSYSGNQDTIGIRVENGFSSHAPFDTSRCARKVWRVFDENPSNPTYFRASMQFMKSDAGSNMNYASDCSGGQYETGYNGYMPLGGYMWEPFYTPPDSAISKAIYGSASTSTTGDDYYIAGNEDGVYETYYPDNSGDAAQLGNWTSLNGLHPPSFDRYAIFTVAQGQTASFNNSVSFSNKAWLRSSGNGVINANAPLFVPGVLQLNDSSTYTHNNTAPPSQSCFGGREFFSNKSTFQILKWSDTTDKIFDELEGGYGNLVINFNNLPEPFGTNKYWTVFKNSSIPFRTEYYITGNLIYIQSSGYQFAPIGFGNYYTKFNVYGNVQIGDSLNQTAFPVMNLSGGTTKAADTTAGTLFIAQNLDIQNGSITCQDFPSVARGRIIFYRDWTNIPRTHTFYCYNPFLWQTSGLGSIAFPNKIESDTLTLKSDMYNSSSAAFLFTDAWSVESGAALNIDTFRIRSLNLTIKNGGKLITKNRDGFNADLANQNVTFEPAGILEFAGSIPQNFQKEGGYNLTSFPNIIMNNPANVTVNMPGINITKSVTFINGKIISNNTNYLTFPNEISFSGESNNSFLSGPVKINTVSTNTKTIPLGKGNTMRGIVIIPSSSNSTDWLVEYFNQGQTFGNTLGTGLTSVSSAEYYLVNRSGPANATVGLIWGANSGVTNPSNLRVARWNDFQWEDKGNSGTFGDPSAGIVFSNMISEFSPFAIASTDNQELPVELSAFTATADRNNVTLNWVTESEENNSGYDIERKSEIDTNWKKITFVNGAGNSNVRKVYKHEDRNLMIGNYSYRIKQIDFNGNYKYFTLQNNIHVGIPGKFSLSQNYPNPFNPTTKINFELPKDAKVTIQVYDMTGRLMVSLTDNQSFNAGYHTVEMNGINFASGTYFYRISAGEFVATKKMQLVK